MALNATRIVVFGATQGVGQGLLESLKTIARSHSIAVHAVSRSPSKIASALGEGQETIQWHVQDLRNKNIRVHSDLFVSLGPIQYALAYLQDPAIPKPKAMWALSSASTDFKRASEDLAERAQMEQIVQAETDLVEVCQAHQIGLQLFKTTLLYGRDDKNINRLASLIQKLRWVPVVGNGRRCPVHVDDVAGLIVQGIKDHLAGNDTVCGVWRLQGGEVLSYPNMLKRIGQRRGLPCQPVRLPLPLLQFFLGVAQSMGLLKDIKAAMLFRQKIDLVVNDAEARQALGWAPRNFEP